jgi:hypothetical protein
MAAQIAIVLTNLKMLLIKFGINRFLNPELLQIILLEDEQLSRSTQTLSCIVFPYVLLTT